MSVQEIAAGSAKGMPQLSGKYLSFSLSDETYGLHILKVQEIMGVLNITKVPLSPEYLRGVINLRGKIIPVIDLRLKFGLLPRDYDKQTCIIVVNARLDERTVAVGIVVDTVLEVLNLHGEEIEPSPEYSSELDTGFVLGIGRTQDKRVVILVDIDKALADSKQTLLRAAGEDTASGPSTSAQ